MIYRNLGNSDLVVSAITLGTRGMGSRVNAEDSLGLIHHALDAGINSIDTAASYGCESGGAELILGKALHDRRDKAILATKSGNRAAAESNGKALSRELLIESVEGSLRRLQTDYLDLFLFHYPDPETPISESVETADALVRQGKIRYYGFSNFTAWQTAETVWGAEDCGVSLPVVNQLNYSLLRRSQEMDLFQVCLQHGLGIMPYQSLQGGILTGKYARGTLSTHLLSKIVALTTPSTEMTDECWTVVEMLSRFAAEVGKTAAQYALRWTLDQPGVSSVVLGVKTVEQIDESVGALGWAIPERHQRRLNKWTAGQRLLV